MISLPILMIFVMAAGVLFSIQDNYSSLKSLLFKEAPAQEVVAQLPPTPEQKEKLLTVVNLQQPLPADYELQLVEFENISCDEMIVASLEKLLQAAHQEGLALKMRYGYIDSESQDKMYRQKVNELLLANDYTKVRAESEAEKLVAPAGKSEYQTGLSVNFDTGENTADPARDEYLWLSKNCVDYGFVLRYPQSKETETGKTFDPACYRYVGVQNAKAMRALDMCLEEFAEYIELQD